MAEKLLEEISIKNSINQLGFESEIYSLQMELYEKTKEFDKYSIAHEKLIHVNREFDFQVKKDYLKFIEKSFIADQLKEQEKISNLKIRLLIYSILIITAFIFFQITRISRLKKNNFIDQLTNVYNRKYLKKILENLDKKNSKSIEIGVLMLDIDYFKKINDTYGHIIGDRFLIEIVKIIKRFFRASDLIGRIGGDEFLIFIKDIYDKEIVREKADALIKKAKEMGVKIKVETNGSTGVKNMLTDEEIKNAKGIIVAADKNVEMARFDGKNVEIVPVKEGIKNPEGLIKNALNKTAPIYKADGKSSGTSSNKKEKTGFYKHLMSGVSNMLPFVVGGGILIALSFMFGINASNPSDPSYSPIAKLLNDIGGGNAFFLMVPVMAGFIGMSIADRPGFAPAMVGGLISLNNGGGFLGGLIGGFLGGYTVVLLKKVFNKLPQSFEGLKPVLLYPLFGIFITGALMYGFIVDPIAALNSGVTEFLKSLGTGNLVLLGIVLAAMMATDMGGPINKSSFTFGIMMITAGDYAPHAAVMAGGMVPPLGIALATTFFKNKFTKDERDAGKTCYIMGLSFITEGAIPFAAADPARVIPASVIGAGIAGGLSMLFGVQLPAPHGGLFVLPVVTHPVMYLVSILIGSIVTAVILGYIKKPVVE